VYSTIEVTGFCLVLTRGIIPFRAVGRGDEGVVRQRHRVIDEERLAAIALDEPVDVISPEVVAVFAPRVFTESAILEDHRVGVPRTFVLRMTGVPEAVFIEACVLGAHSDPAPLRRSGIINRIVARKLPLAGHQRFVPGAPQVMAESARFRVEQPEAEPVAVRVPAGHQLHARRRAERRRVSVIEAHPGRGQPVQIWRAI
jgi:hypothetical protein